jgi:hypothetical protein
VDARARGAITDGDYVGAAKVRGAITVWQALGIALKSLD